MGPIKFELSILVGPGKPIQSSITVVETQQNYIGP